MLIRLQRRILKKMEGLSLNDRVSFSISQLRSPATTMSLSAVSMAVCH